MGVISRQVKEQSSINVLTVLTLILVDSVGDHPLCWRLYTAQLVLSLILFGYVIAASLEAQDPKQIY